jgi:hypothetical protein
MNTVSTTTVMATQSLSFLLRASLRVSALMGCLESEGQILLEPMPAVESAARY